MTHGEAFERVENELTRLGLKDRWGEPITGLEAVGAVHKGYGDEWAAIQDALENGKITPAQYWERSAKVIQQCGRDLFRQKMEKKLVSLRGP